MKLERGPHLWVGRAFSLRGEGGSSLAALGVMQKLKAFSPAPIPA
jgi:hypothetical protein